MRKIVNVNSSLHKKQETHYNDESLSLCVCSLTSFSRTPRGGCSTQETDDHHAITPPSSRKDTFTKIASDGNLFRKKKLNCKNITHFTNVIIIPNTKFWPLDVNPTKLFRRGFEIVCHMKRLNLLMKISL